MVGIEGIGTTITFGTTGFSANLLDVSGPSIERGSIETTHMGTTLAKTFIAEQLYDPGGVDITIEFNGGDIPPAKSSTATETITIDWAGATGSGTWSFSGFMTNYQPTAAIGERMQATATIKATGPISIT